MKRILLIFTLIGLIGTVKALNPQLLINQANNHYVNNEYNDAIVCYHQVLDAGYISAGLYYNLGNAYFKSHNIKNAILYYEKAKLLDPADKDIDTNLEFAKNQTFDKIESIPGVF